MGQRTPRPDASDDRLAIPLDPEEALRALLKVDPNSEPVEDEAKPKKKPKDAKDIYGESWIDRS
jgi:hypothetical protein